MKLTKSLTDRIIKLLTDNPSIRDNYHYILAMIWKDEHQGSAYSFFAELAHKKTTLPETVRRTWQKILQERPELRGKDYDLRHGKLERESKRSIGQMEIYLNKG